MLSYMLLYSLLKHYLGLYITDTAPKVSDICTVPLLLYLMVLKTISPGCGVQASLMLYFQTFGSGVCHQYFNSR